MDRDRNNRDKMDVIEIDDIGFTRFENQHTKKEEKKKEDVSKTARLLTVDNKQKQKEPEKKEKKASDADKPKKGLFLPQNIAIVAAVIVVALLVAAVLITYFAKPNSCPGGGKPESCQDLVCKNSTLTQSKQFFQFFQISIKNFHLYIKFVKYGPIIA
jgi:hypothetical protein